MGNRDREMNTGMCKPNIEVQAQKKDEEADQLYKVWLKQVKRCSRWL
jgi:hypothetical protein